MTAVHGQVAAGTMHRGNQLEIVYCIIHELWATHFHIRAPNIGPHCYCFIQETTSSKITNTISLAADKHTCMTVRNATWQCTGLINR